MGCFLSCFRSRSDPSDLRDPLVTKSQLGDVFVDDESSGRSPEGLGDGGGVDEELRREGDNISTNSPAKEVTSISEESSPEVFNRDKHDISRNELSSEGTEHLLEAESVPRSASRDKSPFENIRNQLLDSSDSPYPTPLFLRDTMNTPGTIYTGYKGSAMSGKRVRTSKQFIYPVLKPIENKLQWMELRDDSSQILLSHPSKRRNLSADSSKKAQQTSPSSVPKKPELSKSGSFSFSNDNSDEGKEVASLEESKSQNGSPELLDGGDQSQYNSDNEKHGVLSLSHWVKPSSADDESQDDIRITDGEQLHDENSAFTDRPILLASPLNWDGENPTPMLPKVWDGNGIPNTTTKYKEDKKVSWHATPFEERLSKILSDEERKLISGRPIQLEEKAE